MDMRKTEARNIKKSRAPGGSAGTGINGKKPGVPSERGKERELKKKKKGAGEKLGEATK